MLKRYSELVKLSHTIFAMPFAMIGYTYAITSTDATFEWLILVQVILCMLFARNTAMGFNRWADRDIDAENPRTASREIPAGVISARSALRFVAINAALFILTASTINMLTAILSPVALLVVMGYSYCKRFTSLAHVVLGLGLSIAPVGAYIAVTGKFDPMPCILAVVVMSWCAGFDIIYALQDREFDRERGLHSIPSHFSVRGALMISISLHVITAAAIIIFGWLLPHSIYSTAGIAIFVSLLIAQHIVVTPTKVRNIGIAFGTLNGIASLLLAALLIIGMLLQ